IMRLDIAVRHGAEDRNSVPLTGQDVRSSRSARKVGSSRNLDGGVGPMGAARTKIHNAAPLSGFDYPGGFGNCEALKVDLVQYVGLHQLRFDDRSNHLHDRLVRKGERSFG